LKKELVDLMTTGIKRQFQNVLKKRLRGKSCLFTKSGPDDLHWPLTVKRHRQTGPNDGGNQADRPPVLRTGTLYSEP
jgi:hypothetical protein